MRVKVFVSYSHSDAQYVKGAASMVQSLRGLENESVEFWSDENIEAGEEWDEKIRGQIRVSHIALVLVSQAFLDSHYCRNVEITGFLERAKRDGLVILPVILSACEWERHDWLKTRQFLPGEGKTLEEDCQEPGPRKRLYLDIRKALRKHIEAVRRKAEDEPRGAGHALLLGVTECPPLGGRERFERAADNIALLEAKLGPELPDINSKVNPTCSQLQREIERFLVSGRRYCQLLLYFCGPVLISRNSGLYLCATDTDPTLLASTAVSLAPWLNDLIGRCECRNVAIVLDSTFHSDTEDRRSSQEKIDESVIEQLGRGKGKVLVVGDRRGEKEDPSRALTGTFVEYFREALSSEAGDRNRDGITTLVEVIECVKERMVNEGNPAVPRLWQLNSRGQEIVLARRVTGSAKTAGEYRDDQILPLRALAKRGQLIPFLGAGIYGAGPLSAFVVSSELLSRSGYKSDERHELATAAQYSQEVFDRDMFLQLLREILDEGATATQATSSHQLVQTMGDSLVVVSSTYDFVLEKRLEAAGRPFTLVSHIIRSAKSKHDGKVLITRFNGGVSNVEISLSDELLLDEDSDFVIYKILGSPYLAEYVDPDSGVDTVVATEADHMKFLTYLRNDHAAIPTTFSVPFTGRRFFFLGYSLDFWHYRLIAYIFKRFRAKRPYSAREPTSPIEEKCWQSLRVELVRGDPEDVSKRLLEE